MLQSNKTQNETRGEQALVTSQVEQIIKLEEMLQQVLTQQQVAQSNMNELAGMFFFSTKQQLSPPSPTASSVQPASSMVRTSTGPVITAQQLVVKPSELFFGDSN